MVNADRTNWKVTFLKSHNLTTDAERISLQMQNNIEGNKLIDTIMNAISQWVRNFYFQRAGTSQKLEWIPELWCILSLFVNRFAYTKISVEATYFEHMDFVSQIGRSRLLSNVSWITWII